MIALLLIWSASFSQSFNKVTTSMFAKYINSQWVTKLTEYPQQMYIVLNDFDITINNEDESHYRIYGSSQKNTYPTHEVYTWNCLDKKGVACLFMMKYFYDTQSYVFSFLYSRKNEMYEYYIEKEN